MSVRVGRGVGRCFIPKREGIGGTRHERRLVLKKEAGDDMI